MKYTALVLRLGCSIALTTVSALAYADEKKLCPDGEHLKIDIEQIAIQYQGGVFSATLSGILNLGGKLKVEPKTLQIAFSATQQWNEYLKGLVVGYNSCAVTTLQFQEGLKRIYPRLQEDAKDLEALRADLSKQHAIDEKRLNSLLKSYETQLRRFESIVESVMTSHLKPIDQKQDLLIERSEKILRRLDELNKRQETAPLAKPEEVKPKITALKQQLLAKADEAEADYNKGYALSQRYRFAEAIPYLSRALENIKLPEFYFALAQAYFNTGALDSAERTTRSGLDALTDKRGAAEEARFDNQLGLILKAKGDLDGALKYAQRALDIAMKVLGPANPTTKIIQSNTSSIRALIESQK